MQAFLAKAECNVHVKMYFKQVLGKFTLNRLT